MTRAKNEILHRVLDSKKNTEKTSARYIKIGQRVNNLKLKDKIIFPVNICPHCGSLATFHRRMQENGDIVDNVWDMVFKSCKTGCLTIKLDYCLDCHKEFLLEIFVFETIQKQVRKKKGWFKKLISFN